MTFTKQVLIALLILVMSATYVYAQTFSSTDKQSHLIELYTSEGCSSCPPADRWLSQLQTEPGLWKDFIPVAFHVDYWDYIGWQDRFADKRFNERQFRYGSTEKLSSVYTPAILINGQEWRRRPWSSLPKAKDNNTGKLTVSIRNSQLSGTFNGPLPKSQTLILNVALLAFDQHSNINAGENQGKELEHNFVVIEYSTFALQPTNSDFRVENVAFTIGNRHNQRLALASWVSQITDQTPIQATGGWLK